MEESQKRIVEDQDAALTDSQKNQSPHKVVSGEFDEYLVNALNDSLIKKSNETFSSINYHVDEIKSLRFESWWVENKVKNPITVIYRLDGLPHEVIIKETKYYVRELYSANKNQTN